MAYTSLSLGGDYASEAEGGSLLSKLAAVFSASGESDVLPTAIVQAAPRSSKTQSLSTNRSSGPRPHLLSPAAAPSVRVTPETIAGESIAVPVHLARSHSHVTALSDSSLGQSPHTAWTSIPGFPLTPDDARSVSSFGGGPAQNLPHLLRRFRREGLVRMAVPRS